MSIISELLLRVRQNSLPSDRLERERRSWKNIAGNNSWLLENSKIYHASLQREVEIIWEEIRMEIGTIVPDYDTLHVALTQLDDENISQENRNVLFDYITNVGAKLLAINPTVGKSVLLSIISLISLIIEGGEFISSGAQNMDLGYTKPVWEIAYYSMVLMCLWSNIFALQINDDDKHAVLSKWTKFLGFTAQEVGLNYGEA